jgi:hypothetical protein
MGTTKVKRGWRERLLRRRSRVTPGGGGRHPDDDGLGGVREPRHPLSPLGTLGAEAPVE